MKGRVLSLSSHTGSTVGGKNPTGFCEGVEFGCSRNLMIMLSKPCLIKEGLAQCRLEGYGAYRFREMTSLGFAGCAV